MCENRGKELGGILDNKRTETGMPVKPTSIFEHYIGKCKETKKWFDNVEGFVYHKVKKSREAKRNKEITEVWIKVQEKIRKAERESEGNSD